MIKIIKYSDKNFNTNLEKIIKFNDIDNVHKIIKKNKDEALFKYAKNLIILKIPQII